MLPEDVLDNCDSELFQLRSCADLLLTTVNDVLDFSKLEASEMRLGAHAVDVERYSMFSLIVVMSISRCISLSLLSSYTFVYVYLSMSLSLSLKCVASPSISVAILSILCLNLMLSDTHFYYLVRRELHVYRNKSTSLPAELRNLTGTHFEKWL